MMSSKEILVWISLGDENILLGRLWCHSRKGRESASFEYNKQWLHHPERFALEPALNLTEGSFHTEQGRSIFGAIGDSAPDRWGRVLMRRAAAIHAKTQGVNTPSLGEVDYLLGVNDEIRQGALRFSLPEQQHTFLATSLHNSVPPFVELAKLLSATHRFIDDSETSEDLRLLLAPGSSLGGARPKACVRDTDGSLAIAKFPRNDDEYSVVLWEAVALRLAERAGLNVPIWRLEFVQKKPVLLIKRFDRHHNQRNPFLSAMSMLNAKDNIQHSYIELVYALSQYGASPHEDMEELWRRIIFTVMISNLDDHLRNHGFLFQRNLGWRLSPVYDVNPVPLHLKPRILSTSIDFDDPTASIELALSVSNAFNLSPERANEIINSVNEAVKGWYEVACNFGITKEECDYMSSAFLST